MEFIEFNNKYLNKIISMTKVQYVNDEIGDAEYLVHEYFKNPSGNAFIELAYDDEQDILAGQYVVIPKTVVMNGYEEKSVLSLNTLTHPDYRGQGIFIKLASEVYNNAMNKDMKFCYGMPNQNSYPGFIRKLEFKDIGEVPLWLRPINPALLAKEYFSSSMIGSFGKIANIFYKPNETEVFNIKILKITHENVCLMDEFWEKVKDRYSVIFKRDSLYIKWRYLDIPLRKYDIYMAIDKNNNPLSFIVGRKTTVSKYTCGMIVDFMVTDKGENFGGILIDYLLHLFYINKCSLVGALFLKNTREADILKKCKFFVCPKNLQPQPFPLIVKMFDEKFANEVMDINNWFFTMGDYDAV